MNIDSLVNALSESLIGIIPLREGKDYDFVLPIKVLEYFAAGLPVVGSGGIEVKKLLDGNRGIFIKNDKKEFSKAINLLLKDEKLRKKMGLNAKEFVHNNFNKPDIINSLYDKIKKL
jgi:glycosyltransferase involved in cell wall biosynthesis